MQKGDNSFGVASLVLGILGSVLGVLILPVVLSVVGLIFGIIQYRREKNSWAIWGMVLSVLGIIISLYVIFTLASAVSNFQETILSCQANPALPGCSDLLKLASVQ